MVICTINQGGETSMSGVKLVGGIRSNGRISRRISRPSPHHFVAFMGMTTFLTVLPLGGCSSTWNPQTRRCSFQSLSRSDKVMNPFDEWQHAAQLTVFDTRHHSILLSGSSGIVQLQIRYSLSSCTDSCPGSVHEGEARRSIRFAHSSLGR